MTTARRTTIVKDDTDILELLYKPGVYTVTITPHDAALLLERNAGNRRPKERAIENYAREMRENRWRLTNQGIGLSRQGNVLDGQNRLYACQRAGVPFSTLLITGLEENVRDVVDVGVKRSLGDVLKMNGRNNVSNLAGAVSLRARYEPAAEKQWSWTRTRGYGQRLSHEEMLSFLDKHPMLEDRTHQAWLVRKALGKVGLAAIVGFESMSFEVDQAAAVDFREHLVSGALLQPGDPRLLLRNVMMRQDRSPDSIWTLGMFVKAWNLWRHGEHREALYLKENERLPKFDEKPGA